MSIDEPTFTYDASKPLTVEQMRKLEEAQHNPPPLRIAEALTSEAKAHQWEHKQLLTWVCICGASGPGLALPAAHAACRGVQERAYRNAVDGRTGESRRFTREEVFFCAGAAAMAAREGQDLVAAVNRAIAHLDGGK